MRRLISNSSFIRFTLSAFLAATVQISNFLVAPVFAQSTDATKLANIEKLYVITGAQDRLQGSVDMTIATLGLQMKGLLLRLLAAGGTPVEKASQIANAKGELYETKMREKTAPIVREAFITYSVSADRNVPGADIDFLLSFYESDAGKAYLQSYKSLIDEVTKPVLEEYNIFIDKSMTSGKPQTFQPKDYSKEIAAINPEKKELIKSIIALGKVPEGFASAVKYGISQYIDSLSANEKMKKELKQFFGGFDVAAAMRPPLMVAYNKYYTNEQLRLINGFLTDPKQKQISEHLQMIENDIAESISPKFEKLSNPQWMKSLPILSQQLPTSLQQNQE